ncbi:hypothetical protein, partial [Proteus terrae]
LNPANTDTASRYFHQLFRQLHWQAPIWLWNVSNSGEITADETPTVLYSAPLKATSETLSNNLKTLLPALVEQGTHAVLHNQT